MVLLAGMGLAACSKKPPSSSPQVVVEKAVASASPVPSASPTPKVWLVGLRIQKVDEEAFAVNVQGVSGPTQFIKVGNPIPGTKYKIVAFNPKLIPPEVVLEHTVTHATARAQLGTTTYVEP